MDTPHIHNITAYSSLRNLCTIRETSSVINDCLNLRGRVQAINDRYKGPLDESSQKNTILPFVFLLGNHSSGKSSFVNYVLQRKVQTAGVAPTDDSFTVIVPGPADVDRDGPSFIGDPDMGFSGLQMFGPTLIHHTQLKVRSNIAISDFMIVDTPGMIDSPKLRDFVGNNAETDMDRGYDFESVVKWYAERADVILLFFDPDKPGTTGETLAVLTNALSGMDHKLYIILNKADQFSKIHDFARAYGSLCWNLSKVIQRKDLPRIYTMCLPKVYQAMDGSNSEKPLQTLNESLADLEATREDVVSEVMNAPSRRQDNEITRLTENVKMLQMHCKVVDSTMKMYRRHVWHYRFIVGGGIISGLGCTASIALLWSAPEPVIFVSSLYTLAIIGLHWWQTRELENKSKKLVDPVLPDGIQLTYQKLYAKNIADKDIYSSTLWKKILDHIRVTIRPDDLSRLSRVSNDDFQILQHILDNELPELRRRAAPLLTSSKIVKQ